MPIKRDSKGRFSGGGGGGGGRSHAFVARVGSGKSVAGGRVANLNKAFKRVKTRRNGTITAGAARHGLNSTTRNSTHAKYGSKAVSRRGAGRGRLKAANARRKKK